MSQGYWIRWIISLLLALIFDMTAIPHLTSNLWMGALLGAMSWYASWGWTWEALGAICEFVGSDHCPSCQTLIGYKLLNWNAQAFADEG